MEARIVVIEEHEMTDWSLAWRLIIDPTHRRSNMQERRWSRIHIKVERRD